MPLVVERPFEALTDVVTRAIPRCRHDLGCGQTPATRAAYEEKIVVWLDTDGLQFVRKPFGKTRIDGLVRKSLPFHQNGALP